MFLRRETRWFILVILVNSGEAKKNIYIFLFLKNLNFCLRICLWISRDWTIETFTDRFMFFYQTTMKHQII